MLEAAAALGHRKTVAVLLSDDVEPSRLEAAFSASCDHRQTAVVADIFALLPITPIHVHNALRVGCDCSDTSLTESVLDAVRKLETAKACFQSVLERTLPDDPLVFTHAARETMVHMSKHDSEAMMSEYLPFVAYAGWPDVTENILRDLPALAPKNLMIAFEAACDAGSVSVVEVLCPHLGEDAMTERQWNDCALLAAQDGYPDLLRYLLSKCDLGQARDKLDHAIYIAAGDGQLKVLTVLVSAYDSSGHDSQIMLGNALKIAAGNGHYNICNHLLSQQASVAERVAGFSDAELLLRRRSIRLHVETWSNSSSMSSLFEKRCRKDRRNDGIFSRRDFGRESNARPSSPEESNALEACLAGYRRYSIYDHLGLGQALYSIWETLANQETHERTLRLLLKQVSDLKETQWAQSVCLLAGVGSIELLQEILANGADPRASFGKKCALAHAASRMMDTLAAVKALVNAEADVSHEPDDEWQAIAAPVVLFDDAGGRRELFPMYHSIKEIFISGPGAVVLYFLRRLPHAKAKGEQYSLLLLMAAAANQYDFVKSLLERGVTFNGVGSYHGTALKASCRFGHSAVTELLLKAGADCSIVDGEKLGTALQFAVQARSPSDVKLLLAYGADTELTAMKKKHYYHKELNLTPLGLAVQTKQVTIAQALIDAGANVNAQCDGHQPILIEAWAWGDLEVLGNILQAGVQLQVQGHKESYSSDSQEQWESAMHTSINSGKLQLVQLLLEHGFDLVANLGLTISPLKFAAARGDASMVKALLTAMPRDATDQFTGAVQAAVDRSSLTTARHIFDSVQRSVNLGEVLKMFQSSCHVQNSSFTWHLFEHVKRLLCHM